MDDEGLDEEMFGRAPADADAEEFLPKQAKRVVARRNTRAADVRSSPTASESGDSSVPGRQRVGELEPITPVLKRYDQPKPSASEGSSTRSAPQDEEPAPARRKGALDAPSERRNLSFDRSMSFADSLPALPVASLRERPLRRRRETYARRSTHFTDNTPSTFGQGTTVSDSDAQSVMRRIRPAQSIQSLRRSQFADAQAFIGAPSAARTPAQSSFRGGFGAPAPAPRSASRAASSAAPPGRPRDPLRIWKLWRDAFGWSDSGYRQDWVTGRLYGRTRRKQRLFIPPARA
jgi:hypothetical protein